MSFSKPPNIDFGQLASSLSFELGKKINQKPSDLAAHLVKAVGKQNFELLEEVKAAGGYINFQVNFPRFSALTLNSIKQLGSAYGFVKTANPAQTMPTHWQINSTPSTTHC